MLWCKSDSTVIEEIDVWLVKERRRCMAQSSVAIGSVWDRGLTVRSGFETEPSNKPVSAETDHYTRPVFNRSRRSDISVPELVWDRGLVVWFDRNLGTELKLDQTEWDQTAGNASSEWRIESKYPAQIQLSSTCYGPQKKGKCSEEALESLR
ncbi:hypothetical protein L218DRAFT_950128 [Marasmius fiardii PR-910]|nr:hypothetical protein L218DRAFT_950128 [Marasmius fiardii PR-910]